jgi:hypothetical protein
MKENIPKEEEKIAVIRAARVSERIRQAKLGILVKKAWWSDGPLEDAVLLLVLFLNFYLIYPLIGQEAPIVTFSGPVTPLLTDLLSYLTKTPFYFSLQIVYIIFLLAFPVSFYFFVKKLTDRKLIAFFACLLSSLPVYMLGRTRIVGMFFSQDGPHVMSLTIVPVALYFLLSFLKGGVIKDLIFASASAALIALISPFGFMNYLIFAAILTFSEVLLGLGRAKAIKFVVVLIFAGALSSFWYNPSFFAWMIMGPMGSEIRGTVLKLLPVSLFSLPILGTFGYLLFDRKPNLQPIFIASFCTIAFFIIAMAGGNLMPSSPARYRTELGISISFFAAYLFVYLVEFLKFGVIKAKITNKIGTILANSLMPIVSVALLLIGISIRDSMIYDDITVLGVWTDVQKGSVWVARDNFMGFHAIIGYAITFLGIILLTFLAVRFNNTPAGGIPPHQE